MEVIDDFLDSSQFESIYDFIMGDQFPWYFNPAVDYSPDDERYNDDVDNYQFIHNFYHIVRQTGSDFFPILAPIIQKINCNKLHRVKSNLNPRTHKHIKRNFHTDTRYKHKTSILYINTNNGWTDFEDGSKVNSVANRMVIFDSLIRHTGVTCTDEKVRVLINFNYDE